jgi:hypothetical protein
MIGKAKEDRDRIQDYINVIDADLTESKTTYLDGGEATLTLTERASLEHERARLRVELNHLHQKIHANRKAESLFKSASMLSILIAMLVKLDLAHLVREAERMSFDAAQRAFDYMAPKDVAGAPV